METELIDSKEVSKILGCCKKTVERLEQRGALPQAMRVGRLRKWSRKTILSWIEKNQRPETACAGR